MYDPESFAKTNKCCWVTTAAALEKYGHLIRWRDGGLDTLVDAGCGPGNLLAEVIYPVIKGKCAKVYAIDLSQEMLNYCEEKNRSLEGVALDVVKMNVENEGDVQTFLANHGLVDHVIASFLLHWLMDEKVGVQNMWRMLKPGGDFFSVHFHTAITFLMHEHVQSSPKWGRYFKSLHLHTPKSVTENHSEVEFRRTLAECGFIDTFVGLKRGTWTMPPKDFVTLVRSAHALINNIPAERIDEYMEDYVAIGKEKKLITVTPAGDYQTVFDTFVSYGRRPE